MNPAPEWCRPREFVREKRTARRGFNRVPPNSCKCNSYAATGKPGPKAKWPTSAGSLCECQIRGIFNCAYPNYHPANDLRTHLGLVDPTEDDVAHVEWFVILNIREWVPEADRGFLPESFEGMTLLDVLAVCRLGRSWRVPESPEPRPTWKYVPFSLASQGMHPNQKNTQYY